MEAKKIFLSTLLVIGVVLLAIGFFVSVGQTVSADDKTHKKVITKDTPDFLKENFNVPARKGLVIILNKN